MQLTRGEKDALLKTLVQAQGKLGLVAVQHNYTVPQLKKIISKDKELSKVAREGRATLEELFKDITDLQLKRAIVNGESWAIAHKLSSNKIDHQYIKEVNKIIAHVKNVVNQLYKDNEKGQYLLEFDELAYLILSSSPFTTEAHLCKAFTCSSATLKTWIASYPSFNESVDKGLAVGESKARDLLLSSAFEPQNKINTVLLKVLSNNVYNIKDEASTHIEVHNTVNSPEERMKEKGIPVPEIEIEDISNG